MCCGSAIVTQAVFLTTIASAAACQVDVAAVAFVPVPLRGALVFARYRQCAVAKDKHLVRFMLVTTRSSSLVDVETLRSLLLLRQFRDLPGSSDVSETPVFRALRCVAKQQAWTVQPVLSEAQVPPDVCQQYLGSCYNLPILDLLESASLLRTFSVSLCIRISSLTIQRSLRVPLGTETGCVWFALIFACSFALVPQICSPRRRTRR